MHTGSEMPLFPEIAVFEGRYMRGFSFLSMRVSARGVSIVVLVAAALALVVGCSSASNPGQNASARSASPDASQFANAAASSGSPETTGDVAAAPRTVLAGGTVI